MQNPEFQIAEQFALQTNRSFFLTGKAGTGKTTLLKQIAAKTSKNIAIVAPTGVAAINAGGVTIHSMFSLPLTSFIPTNDSVDLNLVTNRRRLLDNHMKFRKEKVKVLRELELLIMDEVSMVRADILDAIDFTLRTVRRNPEPFGGLQVMLIGDMHQLPPVVKDNEWAILKQYYSAPYFFNSQVWDKLDAMQIELKQIYRQSDRKFLSLLQNIRDQRMEEDDYEQLKERYQPNFKPTEEGYILLSTHNKKADSVNQQELGNLMGRTHLFEAKVTGEFPDNMFPCERVLQLKEGAQVMFIRNDVETGKYFNGKLAVVKNIEGENITVTFNDNQEEFTLHRETWENISYSVENGTDKIKEDELGTFSQFPLRLAWAITIHKSQGLTFDKVIIDAGHSFAAGQVYVALSRCRTLEGIVLHSLISQNALHGDERISSFTDSHHSTHELENTLQVAKAEYAHYLLKRLFTFIKLSDKISEWRELVMEKDIPDKEAALSLYEKIFGEIDAIQSTARKFQMQLERLLDAYNKNPRTIEELKLRCSKAIEYFTDHIFDKLILPLNEHIKELAYKSKVKKYVHHVQALEVNFWNKLNHLYDAVFMDEQLYEGPRKHSREQIAQVVSSVTSGKKETGGTYKDTLALHKQGKSADEIAAMRGLSPATIKGHFAKWIEAGDINLYDVLPSSKIELIEKTMGDTIPETMGGIKSQLGDDVEFSEIKMVISHRIWKAKEKASKQSS
ncbi:MAG: AAA family ATPase [Bacteroidetes bacterium]|nr:AAA family ATPase [Bacteroidota bacterium]